MTDKYREVKRFPGRVDRVPNEDAEHVGAGYVSEEAVRDLDVAQGDQADLLTDHSKEDEKRETKTEDEGGSDEE